MRSSRLPSARLWLGALAVLSAATGSLIPLRNHIALSSDLLIMLLVVVTISVAGGLVLGLVSALVGVLLVNYFFVPPFHTLTVDRRDNVVALIVFVVVSSVVSVAVDLATKRRVSAESNRLEAELLSRFATMPASETSLPAVLGQVATIFGMRTVTLTERGGTVVAQVGPEPVGEPALRVEAGEEMVLVAYGAPRFAEDKRVLAGLAAAAARALESQRVAVEAARSAELGEIDRVRAALLAAVGHDLRSPLASIKASVSSLRQTDVTWTQDEQAELLEGIETSADRLDDLVGNLLAMSRLQAGVISVAKETVALDQIIARAAMHTDGPIRLEVRDDLDVETDPGLLERVIANLCSNSSEHSSGAEVVVAADQVGDSIVVKVIDHGPGVPEQDRDRIFAPFQRLGDRTATGGIGLGLAIAKGFTEALGGRLEAATTPGGGLTMTVTLPAAAARRVGSEL